MPNWKLSFVLLTCNVSSFSSHKYFYESWWSESLKYQLLWCFRNLKKPIKSCNLNLPLKFFLIYSNCQTFWSWGDKIMTFNGQFVDTSIIDTKTLFIATLGIIGEIITLSWTLLYSFLLSCPPVAKTLKLFGRILHFCAQIVSVFDSAKYFHVF